MRDSLRHHLGRAIRGGHAGRLARIGARVASERTGIPLPGKLKGPLLATFAVTWRCPLRCVMCDLPARAAAELSDEELLEWVDAIADLGPAGLGFTGGEPLLRRGTLPALKRSVDRGMVTHLNTSGITVTPDVARQVVATGADSVNISIDHADPAIHDRVRGRSGAFESAMGALKHLVAARDATSSPIRVQIVMAVDADALSHVQKLRKSVLEAGGDGLSLLPVHDFEDSSSLIAADQQNLNSQQAEPAALTGLENSPSYLDGIAPFLAGKPTPENCSAPRTAVFVDPLGHLFACTPASTERHDGIPATPATLGEIVRSGALASTVPEGRCSRCWWNCHRELDVAIGTLRG